VIGILPGRLATRQRLMVGALLVMGVSLLNLIPLNLGPFGSVWPLALLWPVWGWAGLGPNATTAGLLFILGLWVDFLTGAHLGTWATVALTSHGLILLLTRFVGLASFGPVAGACIGGAVLALVIFVFGAWHTGSFVGLSMSFQIIAAIGLYRVLWPIFELEEDEA
jgi:hypothetical protein